MFCCWSDLYLFCIFFLLCIITVLICVCFYPVSELNHTFTMFVDEKAWVHTYIHSYTAFSPLHIANVNICLCMNTAATIARSTKHDMLYMCSLILAHSYSSVSFSSRLVFQLIQYKYNEQCLMYHINYTCL